MNDCKYDKELCISMPCVDLHFFIKIYICCEEIDNDYKSIVIFDYELPRFQFVFNVFESWPLNTEH